MTYDYPKRTELTFVTVVLLVLSVTSTCWIVIRSIYTISHAAPGIVVFATYLLSLVLMILCAGLLFQRPWALVPLSLVGKGYFVLTIALLLIRAENMLDIPWLFTALCIIYLASLNYINELRTYIGQDKITGRFFAGRAAAGILLAWTCLTIYIVVIANAFPDYTYRISSRDYSDLGLRSDVGGDPAFTWSERWKVAVPDDLTALKRDVGIGAWKGFEGNKIIVTPAVWSQQVEDYTFMGFNDPYEFDKAVWGAGLGQPFLMVLKLVMANEGTQVYHLQDPGIRAIIILNHDELSTRPTWTVNANIYPSGNKPYTVDSVNSSLERALLPVHLTISRYRTGS